VARSNLLDDAFNLARADQLHYNVTLGLTKYLVNEQDFAPWATVGNNIKYISSMLYWSSHYGEWRVRIIYLFLKIIAYLIYVL
jgi:hypothetical protein